MKTFRAPFSRISQGFRVRYIVLATTLLDASEYLVEDLADLYAQRWQVELDIRSLKTHMQMEHLRCKSPSMVRKEVYAHMISYNLIRDLIVRTALRCLLDLPKIDPTPLICPLTGTQLIELK